MSLLAGSDGWTGCHYRRNRPSCARCALSINSNCVLSGGRGRRARCAALRTHRGRGPSLLSLDCRFEASIVHKTVPCIRRYLLL
ncbi:hypothetical protein C7S16_3524 [Burkholderia thailandensis]|uniref:Uncharacterized protein n=1 Tax=Burkholderia thailandensis TaxID=57975 RepID=A0AAW9D553_BURTH|nr:hypothetical protein [Burkholderia thailandensis]MDW9256912.1 hypothetical protein [Burkholderia thailandensis]